MILSFELISGVALGAELFFPDDHDELITSSIRGIVLHILLFRIMLMWGFRKNVE